MLCADFNIEPQAVAACRPRPTKSRETIYGPSIRASTERARAVRKAADRLACVAWNQRMLGYKGPAQPSPALSDALNAGFRYLEVRCLGCDQWLRSEGCVEPIIDRDLFLRASRIIEERRVDLSEEEMLKRLRKTLSKEGKLSRAVIDASGGAWQGQGGSCCDTTIRTRASARPFQETRRAP
jgi:hypothetical protein